ncbi:MAG: response regulator transcription factor [Propionibacteriaceae bacterium]
MTESSHRTAVIIEDDADVRNLLEAVLQQAGFHTFASADGLTGIDLVREHWPVLTTLDVNLPGIDGFEVSRRIRSFSPTYIIMLSARQEEIDTLMGLDAGADDYLTKPFRPRELRARVEAMLRRYQQPAGTDGAESAARSESATSPSSPPRISGPSADEQDEEAWLIHNGLRLHVEMRLVELDGQSVALTRTEFDLLLAIMLRRRRVISKNELAEEVRPDLHGYVTEADRRSVETHLANLRRKLTDSVTAPRFIETVRGVGYRLTPVHAGTWDSTRS